MCGIGSNAVDGVSSIQTMQMPSYSIWGNQPILVLLYSCRKRELLCRRRSSNLACRLFRGYREVAVPLALGQMGCIIL